MLLMRVLVKGTQLMKVHGLTSCSRILMKVVQKKEVVRTILSLPENQALKWRLKIFGKETVICNIF